MLKIQAISLAKLIFRTKNQESDFLQKSAFHRKWGESAQQWSRFLLEPNKPHFWVIFGTSWALIIHHFFKKKSQTAFMSSFYGISHVEKPFK